jgi:hypothetical protein
MTSAGEPPRTFRAHGLALGLLLFCGACRVPGPPPEGRGREWLSVFAASVDRRGSDADQVDDSAAFALEGGYDVLATTRVRAGFEIGVSWSRHDVPVTTGTDENPKLSVARYQLGGRASLDLTPLNAVLYVNGGIYVRNEESNDEPDFEQNGRGNYLGGGLDFWYDSTGRMGPFVRAYDFADSDLTEVLVGLAATFSL